MEVQALSNGLGGQSMLLLWLACERRIPATVSITADTGSEEDRVLCDGSRTSAKDFFDRHVRSFAEKHGIAAFFARARDKDGNELLPLHEHMRLYGRKRQNVPLFGSEGGRLRQTCTDTWKLRAIRQQLRRLGAKKAINAVGLHYDEAVRRISGTPIGHIKHGRANYNLYQTVDGRKEPRPIRWMQHYYPIVDMRMGRQAVRDKLKELGLPYLLTSECDHCPHKDDGRRLASSAETIERVAQLEDLYDGEFFFTARRIPLRLALEEMKKNPKNHPDSANHSDSIFGCHNNYCGF